MLTETMMEMVNSFTGLVQNFLSIPSQYIGFFSPTIVLIGISVLFGWFFGRKAFPGIKVISMVLLSIMFFGFMRWLGVG